MSYRVAGSNFNGRFLVADETARSIFSRLGNFIGSFFARVLSDSFFFRHGRFTDPRIEREACKFALMGPAMRPQSWLDRLESAGYQLSNLSENPRAACWWSMGPTRQGYERKREKESSRPIIFSRRKANVHVTRVCVLCENYIWTEQPEFIRNESESGVSRMRECIILKNFPPPSPRCHNHPRNNNVFSLRDSWSCNCEKRKFLHRVFILPAKEKWQFVYVEIDNESWRIKNFRNKG